MNTHLITSLLVAKAIARHGRDISPCSSKSSFRECVTVFPDGQYALWYNRGKGTYIVKMEPVLVISEFTVILSLN